MLVAHIVDQSGILFQKPLVPPHGGALQQQDLQLPVALQHLLQDPVIKGHQLFGLHQRFQQGLQRDHQHLAVADGLKADPGGLLQATAAHHK